MPRENRRRTWWRAPQSSPTMRIGCMDACLMDQLDLFLYATRRGWVDRFKIRNLRHQNGGAPLDSLTRTLAGNSCHFLRRPTLKYRPHVPLLTITTVRFTSLLQLCHPTFHNLWIPHLAPAANFYALLASDKDVCLFLIISFLMKNYLKVNKIPQTSMQENCNNVFNEIQIKRS